MLTKNVQKTNSTPRVSLLSTLYAYRDFKRDNVEISVNFC